MSADRYDGQDRGGASAYDKYLAAMDGSMRQKVALTAAHLLCEGQVADMGMGSGSGSHALAALYPALEVVGVDVNPTMVARASASYQRANLRFQLGDIAEPCFPEGSLEAILNSSVLHHVTSYGGYDRGAAARALGVHAHQLAVHGVLIVRDFLDPGPGDVYLDLPADDAVAGAVGDDPASCSTAALFERFAREFRSLLPDPGDRGFTFQAHADPRPGWRRYGLSLRHAVEFVLRKDYRTSWDVEVQEEYTFATQAELEATCAELGLRVLASTPLRNPWIVANRFVGRFELRDADTGRERDWPATNIVLVGQKVPPGGGVRFTERAAPSRGYLELTHWRRLDTGVVYDLARRPRQTLDVIPWFRREDRGPIYVLARRSYPRPILGSDTDGVTPIDGATPPTWASEPLNVQQADKPPGQTIEELLAEFANIGPDNILGMRHGATYYPSPGGLQEQVQSVLVEVAPVNVQVRTRNTSGFSDGGHLRALEARQLLRAAQVGGLPDARLELNVYDLLLRQGVSAGAWIGARLDVDASAPPTPVAALQTLIQRPNRRRFRRVDAQESSGFLGVRAATYEERDRDGAIVAECTLERVSPLTLSHQTVAVCCLRRHDGAVLVGLDDDDLPAAQCFRGNSEILVAPAWRLPRDIQGLRAAEAWVAARLEREYGAIGQAFVPLGGRFHPSAGATPEVVFPWALAVTDERAAFRTLTWVPLTELVEGRAQLREGHLKTLTLRAAHALGVIT